MPSKLFRLALVALAVSIPSTAAFADPKTEAALKPLLDRFNENTGDKAALARDLIAFRRAHAGTLEAVKAAEMLAKLPSPLDQLDPTTIKKIEKFDWQPKELVAVLGEHLGRQGAHVTSAAFSPDGKMAASGGSYFVRIWDPVTMRLQANLGVAASCIAFSRDSKILAAGWSTVVYVWDVTTPTPKHKFTIPASSGGVPSIAFGPDYQLAIACGDNNLRVFDVGEAQPKELATLNAHEKGLTTVAWSPDGKTIVSGSLDLSLKTWHLMDGNLKEQVHLTGLSHAPSALHFNPAGTTLAVGSPDGFIRLFTMPLTPKSKERMAYQFKDSAGTTPGVTSLSFSNTGHTLAAGYTDSVARLWTVAGTAFVKNAELKGHIASVTAVAYAPDNGTILTGSADWTVRSWNLMKKPPEQRHEPWSHLSHVYAVAWAPDGLTLATGSEDRVLRMWDMARPEPRTRNFLKGDSVPIYCAAFSPDGKYVAAGGAHANVRQWDAAKGTVLRPCPVNSGYVRNVAYSPDGKFLMASSEKDVVMFDSDKATQKTRINNPDARFHQTAFSPEGKTVVTCSGELLYKEGKPVLDKMMRQVYTECYVKYWSLSNGAELFCDKSFVIPVYAVAITADGKHAFATGYAPPYPSRTCCYDVAADKLTEVPDFKGPMPYLGATTMSPDGRTAISRGPNVQTAIWWDVKTGQQLKTWTLPEFIAGVAFAPDGRHVAMSLGTGVIYILRLDKAG
jgi:WD40 repeat protein